MIKKCLLAILFLSVYAFSAQVYANDFKPVARIVFCPAKIHCDGKVCNDNNPDWKSAPANGYKGDLDFEAAVSAPRSFCTYYGINIGPKMYIIPKYAHSEWQRGTGVCNPQSNAPDINLRCPFLAVH